MPLSEIDRNLLDRCLQRRPRAWEDFVDRFMGLFVHVVNHAARAQGKLLTAEERDDLCADIFLGIVENDFAVLRRFRGRSSLATYLAVVARRIACKKIVQQSTSSSAALRQRAAQRAARRTGNGEPSPEQRTARREQIERLLAPLSEGESRAVRMYHLEGKSYQEIGRVLGVSANSVGSILSRARRKIHRAHINQAQRSGRSGRMQQLHR